MTKTRQRQRKKKRLVLEHKQRLLDLAERKRWEKRDAEVAETENARLIQMHGVKDEYDDAEYEAMVKQLEAEGFYRYKVIEDGEVIEDEPPLA